MSDSTPPKAAKHSPSSPSKKRGVKRKRGRVGKRSFGEKKHKEARAVKTLSKRAAQVDANEKRFKEMKVLFNAIMQKNKTLDQETAQNRDDKKDRKEPANKKADEKQDEMEKVDALFGLMKGRVKSLAMKHDMCRTIQCCFKFGRAEHKERIISELQDDILALAKGKYSCFMLVAFLRHGRAEDRTAVLRALKGHMSRLGTHNCAAHVVELAVQETGSDPKGLKAMRNRLFAEFYGERYRLFAAGNNDGGAVGLSSGSSLKLSVVDVEKRMAVLEDIRRQLQKQTDKGLLRYAFSQRLLWEYIQSVEKGEDGVDAKAAIVPVVPLVYEASLAMVATAHGAKSLCRILAYAQAKDKRKVIKKWKGHIQNMAVHDNGYLVLLAALNVTDDTVLLRKSIINDLVAMPKEQLLNSVMDVTGIGRKVYLFIIAAHERLPRYLTKEELKAMKPAEGTAKKGEEQRKEEYREMMKDKLVALCEENLLQMICDQRAVDVVFEVCCTVDTSEYYGWYCKLSE